MAIKCGCEQVGDRVVPTAWEIKSLGAFVSLQRGHDLTERERRRGQIPVMGSAGQNGFHDTALVRGPGVVIGRSGASFGQAHYCEPDFWPHNTALYVTDFHGNYPLFAFYFLKSIDFSRHNSGGAQQSLNRNFIAPILLAVPKRKEQEAIAEALSDADVLIESLEQLLVKKRQLKQGAMQELLTGKKRLPGFERKHGIKQTEVGVIPEDWEVRPLLTAVQIAQGQVDPKIEPYKSMVLVGPAHVDSGSGKLVNRQTAAEQGAISGKYLFAEGDIIYGKINPYLQKAFLADFSGLCSADMYPLKPSKDISPGFMLAVILGHRFTKYAESVSVRSGMPKINRTEMAEFIFPIPSDKTEQTAIAAILSDMDAEIAALEAKLAKARQLKQGMMQELLTGRIRLVHPSESGNSTQC